MQTSYIILQIIFFFALVFNISAKPKDWKFYTIFNLICIFLLEFLSQNLN
jgi:hypothetical protein